MSGIVPTRQLNLGWFRHFFLRARGWVETWRDASGGRHGKTEPDRRRIAWTALHDASAALAKCGRFDEADQMAQRGLAVFPDERELLARYALNAHSAARYAVAVDRWQHALRTGPDVAMFRAGLAASFRESTDYDRAQISIDDGIRLFPRDPAILTEAARLAAARGRFDAALGYWRKAIESPDPHPDWLQGHVASLVKLGRFQKAETALKAARAGFPDHDGLQSVETLLAASREHRSELAKVQPAPPLRVPDEATDPPEPGSAVPDPKPRRPADPIRTNIGMSDFPTTGEVVSDELLRRLMVRFESLGDNSELGLVQRRYAAEPLGLLRWNSVAFDQLVEAIRNRFQGMGDETNTEIDVAPNGEFFVHDRRWFLGMHTFAYAGQTNKNVLYNRMCRRITYLRDKLLSDLAAAEKIFVYRSSGIDDDRLATLHRALTAIGPATLLAVQPVSAATSFRGEAGDILKVDSRRFVGFVSRDGRGTNGQWNIAFDDWVSICRKVTAEV